MTTAEIKELKKAGWQLELRDNPYEPKAAPFFRLIYKSPRMEHPMIFHSTLEVEWGDVPLLHLKEAEVEAYISQVMSKKRNEVDSQLRCFLKAVLANGAETIDPKKLSVEIEIAYENHS